MLRRVWIVALAMLLALNCLLVPSAAFADGDPGSDVLLDQNLFAGWDANLSSAQQLQLGQLLNATQTAGAPIRVAIIAHQDDLGAIPSLWLKPQSYASYLGYELSLAYTGRLLIVMPNGLGVYWHANPAGAKKLQAELSAQRPSGVSASAFVASTSAAVDRIESDAGVSAAALRRDSAPASTTGVQSTTGRVPATGPAPTASSSGGSDGSAEAAAVVAVLLVLALGGYIVMRSGGRRIRVGPVAVVPVALVGVVLVALVINQAGSSTPAAQGGTLATNPNLDPGTAIKPTKAPAFTLVDESGHRVSLSHYRGKVVVLSFVDAECQTICPLTTQAMVDAKAALGKAGKNVQLLGIDANWKSTLVEDVHNYTMLHGMSGRWHFLTGSLAQLESIWSAYHVNEKALDQSGNSDIEHIAATYVIDRQGRLRDLFTTYPSYGAIGQMGQLIAHDAAALLPGDPRVSTHYSYGEIHGIPPTEAATMPRLGGGRLSLGPGGRHLYLFFATWDAQTTPMASELDQLNKYAGEEKVDGLPPLTAIDEGSVEPSAQALPAFVKGLSAPLSYPIGIDTNGRVADGYQVQGDPWFVLTNAAGDIVWYQEVYTAGWPSVSSLVSQIRAALKRVPGGPETAASAKRALSGSPAPLAALHAQSSQLVGGGQAALDARIKSLHGYPIVLNIWGSWCEPCQREFGLFSKASALYGNRVAFLGADTDDESADARAFLAAHKVFYPSYSTTDTSLERLLPGGLDGTPTTVFIGANGRTVSVHIGQYTAQGTLDQDIEDVLLSSG